MTQCFHPSSKERVRSTIPSPTSGKLGRVKRPSTLQEFQFPMRKLSLDPLPSSSLLLDLLSFAASSLTSRERRLPRRLGELLLMPRERLKRLEGPSGP